MALSFWKDTVTVLRAPIRSKNGLKYPDWNNAASHEVGRVLITPQTTAREFGDRIVQLSDRKTLRANYDADIRSGDRVIFEEATYEIEGEVFHTKSPTGHVSSMRCTLVRWEG